MPIRFRLIRENGEIVESIADTHGLVERAMADLPDLRLLRYVDAYGDTYFNKLQMPDLLRDWNAAETLAQSADDRAWLERPEGARRGVSAAHSSLPSVRRRLNVKNWGLTPFFSRRS